MSPSPPQLDHLIFYSHAFFRLAEGNSIYQLDDAGMNALCRTNRQIYDFLNGHLYRRDLTRRVCKSIGELEWMLKLRFNTR
jgi:hypothetical protein